MDSDPFLPGLSEPPEIEEFECFGAELRELCARLEREGRYIGVLRTDPKSNARWTGIIYRKSNA